MISSASLKATSGIFLRSHPSHTDLAELRIYR